MNNKEYNEKEYDEIIKLKKTIKEYEDILEKFDAACTSHEKTFQTQNKPNESYKLK